MLIHIIPMSRDNSTTVLPTWWLSCDDGVASRKISTLKHLNKQLQRYLIRRPLFFFTLTVELKFKYPCLSWWSLRPNLSNFRRVYVRLPSFPPILLVIMLPFLCVASLLQWLSTADNGREWWSPEQAGVTQYLLRFARTYRKDVHSSFSSSTLNCCFFLL